MKKVNFKVVRDVIMSYTNPLDGVIIPEKVNGKTVIPIWRGADGGIRRVKTNPTDKDFDLANTRIGWVENEIFPNDGAGYALMSEENLEEVEMESLTSYAKIKFTKKEVGWVAEFIEGEKPSAYEDTYNEI